MALSIEPRPCLRKVKAAVHWVRVNALSAESSPKFTWDAMGLRADSARPGCALTQRVGYQYALSRWRAEDALSQRATP